MTPELPPTPPAAPPPQVQPWSRRSVAVVVRFATSDRTDRQPGLVAPASSPAQATWQPGEYQDSVAPCEAVSGNLLGRLVRGAPADQDVNAGNPSKLCVWHVGAHTLIVRIQLHTPGGPAGDQTASVLAREDFALTRQGVGTRSLPVDKARLAPLAGLAD